MPSMASDNASYAADASAAEAACSKGFVTCLRSHVTRGYRTFTPSTGEFISTFLLMCNIAIVTIAAIIVAA